jgi:hypothetical protein
VIRDPKVFGGDNDPIIQNPDIVLTGNSPITKKIIFKNVYVSGFQIQYLNFQAFSMDHSTVFSFVKLIRR